MRKAILALPILLAGCATLPGVNLNTTVSRNTILGIESTYGVVLQAERTYKSLCASKAIPANCRVIVVQLQVADRKAVQAIHNAVKFIEAYPTVDATNVIIAAQTALDSIRTILAPTGVI